MCGRFTLRTPASRLVEMFQLEMIPELTPRYNVAPSQAIAAVRVSPSGARECTLLQWGLIPSWAKDATIGNRMINARSETAATKPSFRQAMRKRRCLVPADGFYEWRREGDKKQPYYIQQRSKSPFAIAGLWESWDGPDGAVASCTLLTTEANLLLKPLHDRMPVIVPPDAYDRWLDPANSDPAELDPLLVPYPDEEMVFCRVSNWVNSPAHEDDRCIAPLE